MLGVYNILIIHFTNQMKLPNSNQHHKNSPQFLNILYHLDYKLVE